MPDGERAVTSYDEAVVDAVGGETPAAVRDLRCPVVIHVGLHKTGTTWLQDNVFRPNAGKDFVYSEDRRILRGNFVVSDVYDYSVERTRADFAPLIEEAESRSLPLVLGDEILAALPWNSRFVRWMAARRMAEIFPGAMVLLSVREQDAVVASSYGHYVRGGGVASLEDFLARPAGDEGRLWSPILQRDHFDYLKAIELYEEVFGEGRVIVSPLEWAAPNPDGFVAMMRERTGFAWSPVDTTRAREVVNPASTYLAYAVQRQANRFVTAETRWQGQFPIVRPSRLGYWVDRVTPASMQETSKRKVRATIRAALGDYYRASNRALSERIGIDLGALGYAV